MILEATPPGFGLALVVDPHLHEDNFSKHLKCQKSGFLCLSVFLLAGNFF